MSANHDALIEELAAVRHQLADLEGCRAATAPTAPLTQRSTRRGLLRLAGAAAVGGAATLLAAQPAAATTGAMQFGTGNDAGNAQTSLTSTSSTNTLKVDNIAGSTAVRGGSSGDGTAVLGRMESPTAYAYGLWGVVGGSAGYAIVGDGGQAQMRLGGTAGPSIAATHLGGEIAFDDTTNALWACVAQGTPGTWRKLASPATAGSLHAISPSRVYDSRKAVPGPQSVLATGANRTISVADGRDTGTGAVTTSNIVPAGATAVAYNLTVVNTVGSNGFLAVNEGGNTTVAASIINWSASGLTLANSSLVKLNASRQITVICGGTATSCNFIIDVVGYYL